MLLEILIFIIVILGYITIIFGLNKFGYFKKYNLSFYGPFVMWRTKRGRKFLDKLSHARTFWRLYGNFGIFICILAMIFMFGTLFFGAIIAITVPTPIVPPQNILVLPGINPIIPLWYGIFALAIAIIIHEFSHGILARRIKIKLKSLGLLFCVIPMGAFVEPDEKAMEKIKKIDRMRIFSAGLTTNIVFGIIFAGIFSWGFMGSLEPAADGVLVLNVTEDFPAEVAGIEPGMVITEVEGITVNGTIIEPVKIKTSKDFSDFMDARFKNDTINLTIFYKKETKIYHNITLVDQYNYTDLEADRGKGFLGVGGRGAEEFKESLAHPVISAGDNAGQRRYNLIQYIFVLPTELKTKILPFHSPLIDAYEVSGPLSVLPTDAFWIIANVLYYLFWINILLGIFNALPAVPLDGGYVFRDGMNGVLRRIKPNMAQKKRDSIINSITIYFAFFILILLILLIVGPYLLRI